MRRYAVPQQLMYYKINTLIYASNTATEREKLADDIVILSATYCLGLFDDDDDQKRKKYACQTSILGTRRHSPA